MDFDNSINIIRFGVGLIVLVLGSIMDIRTRKVPNRLWLISGGAASLLLVAFIAHQSHSATSVFLTIVPIFYYFYFYSDLDFQRMPTGSSWVWVIVGLFAVGYYIWSVFHYDIPQNVSFLILIVFALLAFNEIMLLKMERSSRLSWLILLFMCFIGLFMISQYDPVSFDLGVPIAKESIDASFLLITSIFLIITVIYAMYNSGIIMGGADAKAFMLVSLLIPAYPVVSSLNFDTYYFIVLEEIPLQAYIFPFSMAMLINGALLLLLYPVFFLLLNAARKNLKFPQCLFGFKLPVGEFRKRFVWLLEVEKDGKRRIMLSPPREKKEEEEYLNKLIEAGDERIWVQPKIPFLVPATVGYLVGFFFGNMVYLIIGLFGFTGV